MGAMLTGQEIINQFMTGCIDITPFDESRVGPNSYDLTCGNVYRKYKIDNVIDPYDITTYESEQMHFDNYTYLTLNPGELYLIPSQEKIHTTHFVPLITGRSSIGRLGISIHQEAGFGDIGFNGNWTFQITTTYPIKLYAGMRIAQCYFLTAEGNTDIQYHGRYNNSKGPVASKFSL